ncbi:transglycosylase domain-containing protein [Corynebacterium epidermidicanis]|uniref:Membrane carboxypeptidase (Penicillin-binding protein) n=1 Tax=Corynebacterium epidermidicanis TaxID=1050174 RepID=A0A0G3GLT7_9CORY|nr:transglycosylase domain-containing protein [Corynebacterium epidermidicanis]AKK02156.1 membrane carboxypeptidase (penicillin-binding protein) [Corynebacterium epidermidicanis]
MPKFQSSLKALAAVIAAGIVSAAALAPVASLSGVAIAQTERTMESDLTDLTDGVSPGVTTITDSQGKPIAWVYDQYRLDVKSEQIADVMKQAIVSIEDRRFYEHDGVDWRGTARAMVANVTSGGVSQGASTLNQQYVKNYLYLVDAQNEEEQAAAIETSAARKLREMRMASDLEKHLSKDEILTRYLNIVPYGNGAFGIQAAASTYFGVSAADLSVDQAAMLAGILQSSSALNPYTNPNGMLERRNQVLDAMVVSQHLTAEQAAQFKTKPLGVLDQPKRLPNGCISAGNNGFFCDYAIKYLQGHGVSKEQLTHGGLTVKTTLDPSVQEAAHNAVTRQANPQATGVAEVLNVVQPGKDSRRILAMTSSRTYGLNPEASETVLAQPASRSGNGAGSVFKIFTAAAAIEQGMGIETVLDVPRRVEMRGMGHGGAENCPADAYCVENAGVYRPQMSLKQALAQSPNTTFVKLIEQTGVPAAVDMAVRLGLRDYTDEGSFDGQASIAQYVKDHNMGSFTLGPMAVNPLQLSNVGATIASEGMWCEPNPIESVTDRFGQKVEVKHTPCEQAVDAKVATALGEALSDDVKNGTASDAARAAGWSAPTAAKTGTTESHQSAAFLGFNSNFAAAPYVYNDGTTTASLCTSPLRQCANGNLYGGMEPARAWFDVARNTPGAASGSLGKAAPEQVKGKTQALIDEVVGKPQATAKQLLESRGHQVKIESVPGPAYNRGTVVSARFDNLQGANPPVTLQISDGSQRPAPVVVPSQTYEEEPATPDSPPDLGAIIQNLLRQNGL